MQSILSRVFTALLCLLFASILFIPPSIISTAQATSPRSTNLQSASANELLVFHVNRAVTTRDRGFPRDDPPPTEANGDWTTPVNFAEGTLYYRVQVRSQPEVQDMRLQFCVWQDEFVLENCGTLMPVSGASGTVVTWDQRVKQMWKLNGQSIDWSRPRQRYALAIKNTDGLPVSDFSNWNWNGEDPAAWYPLDLHMTVVVVAEGAPFSGWHNYIEGLPTPTNTPKPTRTPTNTRTPRPTATGTATATSLPPTATATATAASTKTSTATPSATATASHTPTVPPTATLTPTSQPTPTATASSTPPAPATPTPTATATATTTIASATPTPTATTTVGGAADEFTIFLPLTMR